MEFDFDFDFYNQFKDHTTVELLKIVKKPSGYRPEAIKAVTQILGERAISQTEIDEVEAYFQALESKAKSKGDRGNNYNEQAVDFLEPITQPGPEVKPVKWLNILLLVIGLQYLWESYNFIKYLILEILCKSCSIDLTFFLNLVGRIYAPIVFYLVLKRKRWGWVLLFAGILNSFIVGASRLVIFFAYPELYQRVPVTLIAFQLVKAGLCYLLLRKDIFNLFGIARNNKEKTILTAILIAVVLYLLIGYPVLPVLTAFWK